LDGVSIHPVTTKIQVSFLTQLPERKETTQGFHHEANDDFKTVTKLNGCDRRKLRMDQHCTYSTIIDRAKRRKPVNNKTISPKHASCFQQGTKVILQNTFLS
jgi:hypothetical protein